MVQNILVTAITPLQNMDEITCWENRPFSGGWPESSRGKSTDIKRTIKKKPKRVRTAYTTEQLLSLERIFNQTKYITSERRREIAHALNIGDKSVKIWFQNRRMKEKRSSSESSDSSCETSGDISPPPLSPTELMVINSEPIANQPEQHQNSVYNQGLYQSQVTETCASYRYEEPMQTYQIPDLTANGMEFYNDNNLYPTQYYPVYGNNQPADYNYYQNRPENAYDNYWTSDYASCYHN